MLRIGTSLEEITPALNNFDLCASHDDVIPDGVTQTFGCLSYGRYLIIQKDGGFNSLVLCEVKVFGFD